VSIEVDSSVMILTSSYFSARFLVLVEQASRPAADQLLRLHHDAIDQFLDRGNIVDESNHYAAAPGSRITAKDSAKRWTCS
jgi:hypothetical protein